MTNIERCKRVLDSLEARDTSAMGYEAKIRHAGRIEEAREACQQALADEPSLTTVQPISTGF